MKALCFVWGFVAFSILGFTLSFETETFILQDFESNFEIVNYPEEFLPGWAASEVRIGTSRVFQASGKGINGSTALGVQTIGSFDAQIYIKTTTIGLKGNIFSFFARTERNGSGNRPVIVTYTFSEAGQQSQQEPLGTLESFPNADTDYRLWEIPIPEFWWNREEVTVTLTVRYGPGTGTAARWYMDDFGIQLSELPEPAPDDPDPEDPAIGPSGFPSLLQVEALNGHTLELTFDGPLPSSMRMPLLSAGYGAPEEWGVSENRLTLRFSDYLYPNSYELIFALVGDPEGMEHQVAFELQTPIPPGAIIIHEFMADPNPKGLLPSDLLLPTAANDEYIELYNRMDKPIRLRGFTYNDSPVEEAVIMPGEYLLLVPMPRKDNFLPWEPLAGVTGFRALPNGSGQIRLRDGWGNVVDSLTYDASWYGDPQKSQGGWSLERKNPYAACSDRYNWAASQSSMGGTPGTRNSVYTDQPDTRPFLVEQVLPLSSDVLRVHFSKPLFPDRHPEGTILLRGETLRVDSLAGAVLWLRLPFALSSGETYALSFLGINDCFGQLLEEENVSFIYDTDPPKITAVSGRAADEVLLYLDEPIDAAKLPSASAVQLTPFTGAVSQLQLPAPDRLLLLLQNNLPEGQEYVLEISGLTDRFGNSMEPTQLGFFWMDQVDTVFFSDPNAVSVRFKVETDRSSTLRRENYRLDRGLGHPVAVVEDAEEPRTAVLIFDRDFPTNQAITVEVDGVLDEEGNPITAFRRSFTWDTRAIALSSVTPIRPSGLALQFNKSLDPKTAVIDANYSVLPEAGQPYSVNIMDGQTVRLDFEGEWKEDMAYQVRVRSLRDLFGNEMLREITGSFNLSAARPRIDTAYLISPFQLMVQADRALQAPFFFLVQDRPVSAQRELAPGMYELDVDFALDSEELLLTLTLPEEAPISYLLVNTKLRLQDVRLVDAQRMRLAFTDFLDPAMALLPDRYLINGRAVDEVEIEQEGFLVWLAWKEPLKLGSSWELVLGPLQSLSGKALGQVTQSGNYSDGIVDRWVSQAQTAVLVHETALPLESALQGRFELEDEDIEVDAWVNRSQPRQIQLVFSKPLQADRSYRLRLPPRLDAQGKWLSGSYREIRWDTRPPHLQQVEVVRDTEWLLHFDEPLDPVFALVPTFYEVAGVNPSEVQLGPDMHQVTLVFDEPLASVGSLLTLILSGIEDLQGNAVERQLFTFTYEPPVEATYREIVINEVMPAPREGGSLPNVEYVELFNASQRQVQLGGMRFGNNRSFTSLSRHVLEPGEFMILCPASQVPQFAAFGNVMGVSPWPTLLNAGDEVWIGTAEGSVLDRFAYDNSSFGSATLAQGGYSLELVNPYHPCESPTNIRPSKSPQRGTPGQQNSVFDQTPDRISPRLLQADPIGPDRLRLRFSKAVIDRNRNAQISLVPSLDLLEIAMDPEDPYALYVTFALPFESNQRYEVTIADWTDCAGNALDPQASRLVFKIPAEALPGDIVLNEILFNPRTGGPKFVEIYNASDKYIDLKNWKLANVANWEVANRRVISGQTDILLPGSYRVFTTDAGLLHQHYPRGLADTFHQMSLPSYPIGSGTVVLLNPEETIQERYSYHERHHHPLLREVRGVSLERLSIDGNVDDPENWQSASATVGYATPGFRNSQIVSPNPLEQGIQISPKVFVPDGVGEAPFTTISYTLDQSGFLATLRIYSTDGRMVRELCQNQLWGLSGFYTWDGTDERGARVKSGYYVVWVELFHPDGTVNQFKKTVVVGTKF
ncbi:MAG: lamin tail domain-containing protein [Lunatimonas sp.]|uniref:lamin tail domain-containing protein n=1 Tax=Lunatimonas sp. TaxID=2060141 RepID=UPI00263B3B01|nr:lamin tail domain-containing protein [Lunatimonas sp.]MCC5937612.1 lamin tail domain-containing protein [Lunatimonas sp.]